MKAKDFLILLTRLFLAYIFLSAGFCKLTHGHFGQLIGPPWLEERLAEYGLGLFAQVVAYSQIVCGALLISQRFSTLGAIMLFPMNVSILAVTVSQNWQGTPYINTVFLILNLLLLIYEWPKFRFLFQPGTFTVNDHALDSFRSNYFNLAGLMVLVPAAFLATTGFYIMAAVLFSGALILFGIPLVTSSRFSMLERVMLAQSFGAMLMVTLAFRNPPIISALGGNIAILTIILIIWMVMKIRKKEPEPAPENCFV